MTETETKTLAQKLVELRQALAHEEHALLQITQIHAQTQAMAEARILREQFHDDQKELGSNEHQRDVNMTVALAKDGDYQQSCSVLYRQKFTVLELKARIDGLRDLMRERELDLKEQELR